MHEIVSSQDDIVETAAVEKPSNTEQDQAIL